MNIERRDCAPYFRKSAERERQQVAMTLIALTFATGAMAGAMIAMMWGGV